MILITNNRRDLFLAAIDLWLKSPDVRELRYWEKGLEITVIAEAASLAAGQVCMNTGDADHGVVSIHALRAAVESVFEIPAAHGRPASGTSITPPILQPRPPKPGQMSLF